MKLKRVTSFVIILVLPYMIGCKKINEGIKLDNGTTKYGITKEKDSYEIKKKEEKITYEDQEAFINYDQSIDSTSLNQYEKVTVLEKEKGKYLIETNDYENIYIDENSITLLPDDYIEVDIEDQSLKLYQDNDEVLSSDIVSGKNQSPTDLGYYQIEYKDTNVTLKGSNSDGSSYESFVSYWMPFNLNTGEGLHDATWRDSFGGDIYEYEGSHGCVNMPYDNAEELYNNIETGTKVLIHK